jgi:hypothetical protein
MRFSSTIAGLAVLGAAVAAWAALPAQEQPAADAPALKLTAQHGSGLAIRTSLHGRPILIVANLIPGAKANGWVTVANTGDDPLMLRLASRNLTDQPGPNGGRLSEALQVRISQIIRRPAIGGARRTVYAGSLAALGRLRLKSLRPKTRRRYGFRVWLPDTGTPSGPGEGDNAYQGAMAGANFIWIAAARRPGPKVR